ncbi:MAG: DUF2341 domain-containing protein, partial [Spirochaetes bacterium]|nr:DUF2341 domain-containing protein [Spirochaetota bacterium]
STSTDNSVTYDATGPSVTVDQAGTQSDPTSALPIEFTIVFSEAIDPATFATADITQSGTATGITWSLATSDNITWTLSATAVTGDGTLVPSLGAGVVTDTTGNGNSASTSTDNSVTYDSTGPSVTINQAGTQSDPTSSLPIEFTIVFSEAINPATFATTDITQSGTATGITWSLATSDNITWTLSATTVTGQGTLVPGLGAGVVTDALGNGNSASTSTDNSVTYDATGPSVTINQATGQADPATGLPVNFTIVFSEAINPSTFSTGDITQNGTASGITWSLATSDNITWTLSATAVPTQGTLVPSLGAGVVTDIAGNANAASTSTDNSVTYDMEPSVTINQASGQPDPTNTTPINFTIVFSEAIDPATFDVGDIKMTNGAGYVKAKDITWSLSTSDNITWTLTADPVADSGMIEPSLPKNSVQDLTGNNNTASTSTDNTVTYDPSLILGMEASLMEAEVAEAPNLEEALRITSAVTMDADGDGRIDHYRITFSRPVNDSSFPGYVPNARGSAQAQWLVHDHGNVVLVHGIAAPEADTVNDTILYLAFEEGSFFDTDTKPDLTTTAAPGLDDTEGNPLARVNTASVGEEDGAAPIITRFHGAPGQDLAYVDFSEPVVTVNGGVCGDTGDLVTADFTYHDDAPGGASDLSGIIDAYSCDKQVQLRFNAPLTTDDTVAPFDKIGAASGELFDGAGNAALAGRKVNLDPDGDDSDADGLSDILDNCPHDFNPGQDVTAPNPGMRGDACYFTSSATVTIDATGLIGGDVSDFPVLLRLGEAESAVLDSVRNGAPNIRFIYNSGTEPGPGQAAYCPYEIERWDPVSNRAEIWVKVPAVSATGSDFITMWYDDGIDGAVQDRQDSTAVFDAGNNFAGVWHMHNDPSAGAGAVRDSTAHANDGTATGMDASALAQGMVGTGLYFNGVDGSVNEYIDCGSDPSLDAADRLTIEAWGYYHTTDGLYDWRGLAGRFDPLSGDSADYGIDMTDDAYGGQFRAWINDTAYWTGMAIPQNNWFHVVFTYEHVPGGPGPRILYLNGTTVAGDMLPEASPGARYPFRIGGNGDGSWLGVIDEVRISNTVRSADWIRLSYENQRAGQSVVTVSLP